MVLKRVVQSIWIKATAATSHLTVEDIGGTDVSADCHFHLPSVIISRTRCVCVPVFDRVCVLPVLRGPEGLRDTAVCGLLCGLRTSCPHLAAAGPDTVRRLSAVRQVSDSVSARAQKATCPQGRTCSGGRRLEAVPAHHNKAPVPALTSSSDRLPSLFLQEHNVTCKQERVCICVCV